MSSSQSLSTLESKLEALQCHFNWNLDCSRSTLFRLKYNLEDIGTEEGKSWLGHIYNLQGFIHYQLGFSEDALRFFSRATEAFRQMRNTVSDEGPWLVVNYGNLAWLHNQQGEQVQSQNYLSKINALMNEYPSPSQDELHPEIYAEKAWTLMKFNKEKKLLAIDYFQRAIRMQPDMVAWQTSYVLALVNAHNNSNHAIVEKMRIAKEHDPENLYLAALYLDACPQKGTKMKDEVCTLARRVLKKPVSSYSGINPILMLYSKYLSVHEAIDLIEEALERHPDERYLKWCAANCYRSRIFSRQTRTGLLERSMIDKAISLCKEVISLYPHSSLKMKITLADIYVKVNNHDIADQIYNELLESDLEYEEQQMLYNKYAKHLYFNGKLIDRQKSIDYHKKAAAIPHQSSYRKSSITMLEKYTEKYGSREIEEFLMKLQQ
ncbi:poly [ADP-ribose] polymerase 2/3/4 [Sarotherodon galilaeus]